MPEGKELLTVAEVAELLNFTRQTVSKFVREGKLKAYIFGREYRIKRDDVENFLEESKFEAA